MSNMLAGTCAFCANATHFTARSGRLTHPRRDDKTGRYSYDFEVSATCDACHRFNAANGRTSPQLNSYGEGAIVVGDTVVQIGESMAIDSWSPPLMIPVDTEFLPEGVAGFLQEAHDAFSISAYRAVVLLVRSVIEATARDKKIESGSLVQKINHLHADGHIRTGTRDMAHVLRVLGNDMAHGEIDDVPDQQDAKDALTVVRFVLDDVYVADARRADMMSRRGATPAE